MLFRTKSLNICACFLLRLLLFLSDTAVLGELLIGMNEILKIIRPQKKVHRCQASAISTECRKQLLQIHKVAPTTWVLKDYGDPDKFQAVYNAVLEYTGVIYEHYVREELDEKAFVQPAVRDRLWPALRPILNCGLHFELENEREFLLRRANEGHYAEIDGLTDHCVKMMISDDRLLTLEDKSVLKKLEEADIAQAQSQLAYEVEGIGRPSIPQFVGILQNGCDWSFLSRQMDMGKERWEYVQLNPTFTEDGINHGAVHTVSRFLQHTLCIVDAIYAELILPRYRTVESIAESKTEDGSKDDEGSRDDRDGDDHPPPAGSDNRVHPRHQREDAEGPL